MMNLKTLQQIMSATDASPEEVLLVAADACEEMGLNEIAERFRWACETGHHNIIFAKWKKRICDGCLWGTSTKIPALLQWNEFIAEHKRTCNLISTRG